MIIYDRMLMPSFFGVSIFCKKLRIQSDDIYKSVLDLHGI